MAITSSTSGKSNDVAFLATIMRVYIARKTAPIRQLSRRPRTLARQPASVVTNFRFSRTKSKPCSHHHRPVCTPLSLSRFSHSPLSCAGPVAVAVSLSFNAPCVLATRIVISFYQKSHDVSWARSRRSRALDDLEREARSEQRRATRHAKQYSVRRLRGQRAASLNAQLQLHF